MKRERKRSAVAHVGVAALWAVFPMACSKPNRPPERAEVEQSSSVDVSPEAVKEGAAVHRRFMCNACHSLDGSTLPGPTYLGIFGTPVELVDGTTVMRDESYMREAILRPKTHVIKGFEPNMPNYESTLTEGDVDALVVLIKSLRPDAP